MRPTSARLGITMAPATGMRESGGRLWYDTPGDGSTVTSTGRVESAGEGERGVAEVQGT